MATPSGRAPRSTRPNSVSPRPSTRNSWRRWRAPLRSKSPRPGFTGPSPPFCASRATYAGVASTRPLARIRTSLASLRRRWCAATKATGSTTRRRFLPRPSTSRAIRRRKAEGTRRKPTFPAASSAPGICRRLSVWPVRGAAPSCWATRQRMACRSRSTSGYWAMCSVTSGATRACSSLTGTTWAISCASSGSSRTSPRRLRRR